MKISCFLILTILLGNIFGCQSNSQNKSQTNQESQTNQKHLETAAKSDPLKLKLNLEEAGTTADTSILSDKLEKIFKEREDNGVFRENSNEVEKSVYLAADRSASAEEIAELFKVLKNAGTSPIMIPIPVKTTGLPKPNPLFLVVYAGSGKYEIPGNEVVMPPTIDDDKGDSKEDESFNDVKGVEIEFAEQSSSENLIVISRDGSFKTNGKQISKDELKTAIENSLKSNDEKAVYIQAENYGNMEDAAKIADSAGVSKVYFITKKIYSSKI